MNSQHFENDVEKQQFVARSASTVVDDRLDWFGRFANPCMQQEFVCYCLKQRSFLSVLVAVMIITVWVFAETIASLHINSHKPNELAFGVISFFLVGFCWILSSLIGIITVRESYFQIESSNRLKFIHSNLQVILIFAINLLLVLKTIKQITFETYDCIPSIGGLDIVALLESMKSPLLDSLDIPRCPPTSSFYSISTYNMVIVMCFTPLLLLPLFFEPRYYLVLMIQIALSFCMVYSVYDTFYSVLPTVSAIIIILLANFEFHRQRIRAFLTNYQLQELLREKERNADRVHALEMRSMIGNVAHDLKTPLASFTTGMELIQSIIESTRTKLTLQTPTPRELVDDCLGTIESYLHNIRNTSAFMLMTINRCIDYTKASKGISLVPKNETIELKAVLEFPISCMANIQDRISIKMGELCDGICSHVITDKQWLQENVLCLLSNAVKYSAGGEVTVEVSLMGAETLLQMEEQRRCRSNSWESNVCEESESTSASSHSSKQSSIRREGQYLLFEIEDTGIGVSEEAMRSLFSPFKQAQRLAGGTGLGLYSLAKRVEALRGFYGVQRRKDSKQGSLFWFAIPYRPDSSAAQIWKESQSQCVGLGEANVDLSNDPNGMIAAPVQVASNVSSSSKIVASLEVLVVDDSPSILKMSSMMLKRQGHTIWTAENGEIALKRIEEKWKESGKGFDLVLMDLQMPVMDGLEATRRLRRIEEEENRVLVNVDKNVGVGMYMDMEGVRRHQLIIGVSANSDHETMEEALSAGIDDFLGKPFTAEALNLRFLSSCTRK